MAVPTGCFCCTERDDVGAHRPTMSLPGIGILIFCKYVILDERACRPAGGDPVGHPVGGRVRPCRRGVGTTPTRRIPLHPGQLRVRLSGEDLDLSPIFWI